MAVPFSTVGYSNPAGWGTSGQPGGSCRWSSTRQLRSADRRSEPARPGDLLHLDVNRLDPIPTWRPPPPRRRDQPRQPWRRQVRQAAMRTCTPRSDDHSVPGRRRGLDDERAPTCARLWRRPHYWFALHDASITGVLSDMGRRPKPRVRGGAGPDRRAPPADQALRHRLTATWSGSTASRSTWCHLTTPGTAARSTGPPHREPPRVAATPGRSRRRLRRGRKPWRLVGGDVDQLQGSRQLDHILVSRELLFTVTRLLNEGKDLASCSGPGQQLSRPGRGGEADPLAGAFGGGVVTGQLGADDAHIAQYRRARAVDRAELAVHPDAGLGQPMRAEEVRGQELGTVSEAIDGQPKHCLGQGAVAVGLDPPTGHAPRRQDHFVARDPDRTRGALAEDRGDPVAVALSPNRREPEPPAHTEFAEPLSPGVEQPQPWNRRWRQGRLNHPEPGQLLEIGPRLGGVGESDHGRDHAHVGASGFVA